MKNIILKELIREIKGSFGRFMSIFGIVFVGVAFFVGVRASAPYMKASADDLFDRSNLFDLRIFSQNGLTDDDLEKISQISGVAKIKGAYRADFSTVISETEQIFQVMSLGDNSMNSVTITKGRMPETEDECIVRDYNLGEKSLMIGDKVKADTPLLNNRELTVVGYCSTPYYLSYQYDSSDVGDGNINGVMFVKDEAFTMPVYYCAYVLCEGAEAINSYEDAYFDITDPVKAGIEDEGYTVLDRKMHFSYVDYGNCSDRMAAIAKVFPLFFYLVAALVCLTTMTRMVDEQRGYIGTMKALGYRKGQIAFKFLAYAIIATIFGGVLGCLAGLLVFPNIIITAWGIVYTVDKIIPVPQYAECIIAVAIAAFVTAGATLTVCMSEIRSLPAMLLRPKAPKSGKKVLLEKITFIWRRISFSRKVTFRNVFLYKKRLVMTLIGIAGCTALMLAGFGIKNSVSTVITIQYDEVFDYDADVTISPLTDTVGLEKYCDESPDITGYYMYSSENITCNTKNAKLLSAKEPSKFAEFIGTFDNETNEKILIPKEGALVTYKLAKEYGLKEGSEFVIKKNDKEYTAKVFGIIKMCVGQYVMMFDDYYEELFSEKPAENVMATEFSTKDEEKQKEIGRTLISDYHVKGVSYFDGIASKFGEIIASLDKITLVLIVSAALLALVVLCNLINVNISERIREIATIKVLGFRREEVSSYIFREIMIITLIGAAIGLGLGVILHSYIMDVIEMDDVIFPKKIFGYSFAFSYAITIVFELIVNLIMRRKIRRIPMVESLKAVE